MRITEKQKEVLHLLNDERYLDVEDERVHNNTFNALHKKGLVTHFTYANMSTYELTDKGLEIVKGLLGK